MDYISRKSLSKYLMDAIEFNKHDINIFMNEKYAGVIDIGQHFKITRRLELRCWPARKLSQPPQGSLPELPSNVSPELFILKYLCKFDIVYHRGLQTAMSISGTSCKYNFVPLKENAMVLTS